MGAGDWNEGFDQMSERPGSESIFTTQLLCRALAEVARLAAVRGDTNVALAYGDRYDAISSALNGLCWDGDWYTRATDGKRTVAGSRDNPWGQIFLNPQSWAVISGTAPPERACRAMSLADERLWTHSGHILFDPACEEPDGEIGMITRLAPGRAQNAGISVQADCWAAEAHARLGNSSRAWEIVHTALECGVEDQATYKAEP